MPLELAGRIAVITGAASGIGRALALQAAQDGMKLALADNDAAALRDVADEARVLGASVIQQDLDVRSRAALDEFARTVTGINGDIALVFANAGVMRAATSWVQSPEDWDLVLDVNVKGAVHTASAFIPALLAQERRSRIVFTGSTSAFSPRPHLASYSASKHALWGIAESMHLELADLENGKVGVSFLAPAGVKTAIADAPGAPQQDMVRGMLQNFGMPPEELAAFAFDALKQERFWILPHPDFKAALEKRTAWVAAEEPPSK
jgi:NAD(P)-dependent dehydrogenase (short-subunit alcohol dehydrogenase family)